MPLFHCVKCHHEWEGILEKNNPICDWCGAHGYIIEEKTPFEKMIEDLECSDWNIDEFLKI